APSMADIWLSLLSSPSPEQAHARSIVWLAAAISIEDAQDLVREAVQWLPADATAIQKADVMARQLTLQTKVQKHQDDADSFMEGVDILEHCRPLDPINDDSVMPYLDCITDLSDAEEPDEEGEYVEEEDSLEEAVNPQDVYIWMPSRLKLGQGRELRLGHLMEEELQLQQGQANDSLAKLQAGLRNLAILYRQNLQSANSVHSETRAQKAI
ncbi:hypothetical protein PAXRUDRAFT_62074, partial [Paxillus rubicundulus Ve08.2h10]